MHIMVDLETMGVKPDAAIIAIGAVAFTEDGTVDKFYREVSLQSSMNLGSSVCASTVMWWLQQDVKARSAFNNNEHAVDLSLALLEFTAWLAKFDDLRIWGNGAGFDNVVLRSAFTAAQLSCPWAFWQDRCFRTLRDLAPNLEMIRVGTFHNAVDDAETQALHAVKIFKWISESN